MILGAIGIVYGFMSTPSTKEEAKEILAEQAGHEGGEHAASSAGTEARPMDPGNEEGNKSNYSSMESVHGSEKHAEEVHGEDHLEHALHKLQNRPWSAIYIAAFFFMMIALGTLVFYAAQYASKAGWAPVLYNIMEGITSYLLPGSIIVGLIVIFAGEHFFPWQNQELVEEDSLLQLKSSYLNFPFFVIRAIIYIAGWNIYRYLSKKYTKQQVNDPDNVSIYRKHYKASIIFLSFFLLTEFTMGVDWFMSMNPHWYSTLYSWYVFATMFVSAITVIAMVTMYLKKKGLVPFINNSHLHDLAKYMFAFSIFWTYLWFAQFMLIWYANMPEEAAYFAFRIENYNVLFFGMLILNFVFPILVLMNSDFKRVPWLIFGSGLMILIGHYIDLYLLVVPSTVGTHGTFGIPEISGLLFFAGLFILTVGTGLGKTSEKPVGNPFLKESENYHI